MLADPTSMAPPENRFRMLVAGIGGAGIKAVSLISARYTHVPDLVAIHTDAQTLNACRVPRRVQLGTGEVQGFSTGGNANIGRLCAENDADALRELFADVDLVFFIVGLGGGTGSGVTPVALQMAREMNALTLCLATLPFDFEGTDRRRKARVGLDAIQSAADAVVCFPNQRLGEMLGPDAGLSKAFETADAHLTQGVLMLWELLSRPGLIHLDFANIRTLVAHSGKTCTLAAAQASGPDRVSQVSEQLLHSPLLDRGAVLAKAQGAIIGILGGDELSLAQVEAVVKELTSLSRPNLHLMMGVTTAPDWDDTLSVVILASESWESKPEDAANPVTGDPDTVDTKSGDAAAKAALGQAELELEPVGRGRFANVEPTIKDGQDLDIPTYIRKGIKLSS